MKSIYLFLAAYVCSIVVSAQSPLHLLTSGGVCGQPAATGGYYTAGSYFASNESYNVSAQRIGNNGTSLWGKGYNFGGSYETAQAATATSDNGFLIAGGTSPGSGTFFQYLIKTDSLGTITFSKTYGNGSFYSVKQSKDGGFVAAGLSFKASVLKTDVNGVPLWQNTYDSGVVYHVTPTDHGGYVATGYTTYGEGDSDILLFKLSANGDVQWYKTLGWATGEYGHWIEETSDGGFVLVGSAAATGAVGARGILHRTDAQGNALWTKLIDLGDSTNHTYEYANSVAQSADSGFTLVMYCGDPNTDFSNILVHTDIDGKVLWAKDYGPGSSGNVNFTASVFTQNNNTILNKWNGGFYRVDKDGNSGCEQLSVEVFVSDTTLIENSSTPVVEAVPQYADVNCIAADLAVTSSNALIIPDGKLTNMYRDTICSKEFTALQPAANTVRWNTGSTMQNLEVSQAGDYFALVRSTSNCVVFTDTITISVLPLPDSTGFIMGDDTICNAMQGKEYHIEPVKNASYYVWNVPFGSKITNGDSTEHITVDFGQFAGNISVTAHNRCGENAKNTPLSVNILPTPWANSPIEGDKALCEGDNALHTYTTQGATYADTYEWTIPEGAVIETANGSQQVQIRWGAMGGDITCVPKNMCGVGIASVLAVNMSQIPVITDDLKGDTLFCELTSNKTYFAHANGSDLQYQWLLPSGAYISQGHNTDSVIVNFSQQSGYVTMKASNMCGVDSSSLWIHILRKPSEIAQISGADELCNGTSSEYSVLPDATVNEYVWTIPDGSIIESGDSTNAIVLKMGNKNGYLILQASNICGTAGKIKYLKSKPLPAAPSKINGSASVCVGKELSFWVVSDPSVVSYQWNVPADASVKNGQGTAFVTVLFGNTSGAVSATAQNACGDSNPTLLNIKVNDIPKQPAIEGDTLVCANAKGIIYKAVPTDTLLFYSWTLPQGATNNGDTDNPIIKIDFSNNGGNITVKASNNCGVSSLTSFAVNMKYPPATPDVITGDAQICENAKNVLYSIPSINGADTYKWNVVGNAAIQGSNDNDSVRVNFGSESITLTVSATNNCGSSSIREKAVQVKPLPKPEITVSGLTEFCTGGSVTLSTAAAEAYLWSNQQTTPEISVTSSGLYSVTVTKNGCKGTSLPVTITVNPLPPLPTIQKIGDSLVAVSQVGVTAFQWFFNAQTLQGATSHKIKPTTNGNYSVRIADVNGCMATSNPFFYNASAIKQMQVSEWNIYPIPANDVLMIENIGNYSNAVVAITDVLGKTWIEQSIEYNRLSVDVSKLPQGNYIVLITTATDVLWQKISKQ